MYGNEGSILKRYMKDKYFRVAKDISRWKINSPIENFLAGKADNSYFWKKLYIQYYKLFDRKYYDKGCEFIKKEIEKQRPNFDNFSNLSDEWLKIDMLYSLHRFGITFADYFIYRFYDLNCYGRQKYNNLRLQYGYCEQFNDKAIREICDNKSRTYDLLKDFYKREVILVDNPSQDISGFKNRIYRTPHSDENIVFKPLNGNSGKDIRFIPASLLDTEFIKTNLEKYGPFILEEVIEQDPALERLYPHSINTIRVATVRIGKEVNFLGTAIRIGRGKSRVDNAGSGGMYAGIDLDSGIIISKGMDYECNEFIKHPDTKVIIPGFSIPKWNELLSTVREVATAIDGAALVAWDFALSKKGWCLVEANDVGGQTVLQAPFHRGINPILYVFFDKINDNKTTN